jgi:hypothetical protein
MPSHQRVERHHNIFVLPAGTPWPGQQMAQINRPASAADSCPKTWTRIRPIFKSEFAAFSDDKLIIDGIAKLLHQPNENPRMFFSRLEELIFVLKENYASYRVKPERMQPQAQGSYTEDNLTKFAFDSVDTFANFMFTQKFKAAALEKVSWLLSLMDQTRLTVEDAYNVFFTDHRLEMDKKALQVHAVSEKQDFFNPEQQQDIAAFKPQQRQQNRPQQISTTVATTNHKDKDTDRTSATTTAKTPTSRNPILQETVNSVSIAKS